MSRTNRLLATALVAVSVMLVAACSDGGGGSLSKAQSYIDKRDFKSATIELKSFLQDDPESGAGRFLLGKAMLETGDMAGSEAELNRAIEYKYSEEAVAPLLAKNWLATRQFRKLLDKYGKFEIADVQAAIDLKVALGLAAASLGQKGEAEGYIKRALEIKPTAPDARVAQARLLANDGKYDEAIKALNDCVADTPNAEGAWHLLGDLRYRAKADLAGAEEAYRKALAIRNDLPDTHAALISLAYGQKHVEAAAKQLEELKKILPNHPQTKFFEAQAAFARGDFAAARELLQPLLRFAPDHIGLLHLSGATEFKLNNYSQAEAMLSRAVQLSPGFAGARRVLAQVYLRGQQPSKAQEVLKPLLDKELADSEALSLMGQAAGMLGDAKSADEYFARAAKLKPQDTRIRAAQALTQLSRGNADTALVELETLAAGDKGSAVDLALISAHLRRNELAEAQKAIDALDKKLPNSGVAPNLRGRVQLQQRNLAAARASFEEALKRDPKFTPAAAALAALDMAEKKPEAAKERFNAVLKVDPKNAQAMLAMAELTLRTSGEPAQVQKWIADAVAAEPANVNARLALVEHHMRQGRPEDAVSAAQTALGAIPDQPDLLDKQARAQMAMGQTQQGLTTLARITQVRPESPVAFINLGEAQANMNDLVGASRSAARALELAPTAVPAQRLAMSVAIKQKRWKDAIAIARDVQKQQPTDASGFVYEGEIELGQQNLDNAITAFRKGTATPAPQQSAARLHSTLVLAKREAEANKFAEGWVVSHPKDTLFFYYLGDIALAKGDSAQAEKRYAEVLKIQPEHALALNNIAWMMVQQKRAGAAALAERAVKAAPDQPPLLDTLAMALAAESQLPRAIEVQKKAVAMAPQAPSFRLNLAKLHIQAGDKASARTELRALEKLGTRFGGQAEVGELLKSVGG